MNDVIGLVLGVLIIVLAFLIGGFLFAPSLSTRSARAGNPGGRVNLGPCQLPCAASSGLRIERLQVVDKCVDFRRWIELVRGFGIGQ